MIRSSPILEYAPTTLIVITWVGAITALFAGLIGIVQNDLKRIIAFSTCSQIGYLFIAVGLSQYNVAIFHLVNHAFFKALLFLAAGGVLHAISDAQDIRRIGGLVELLPLTYVSILIGSLSLIAIPWLSGFISKDLILELAYGSYHIKGILVYIIGSISACLTGYYSIRLIYYTFYSTPNANVSTYNNIHDTNSFSVFIPYTILGFLSIFFGYFAHDLYVGIGTDTLVGLQLPGNIHLVEAHFGLSVFYKNMPFILTLLGSVLAILISSNTFPKIKIFYTFFNQKWIIDILYSSIILYALHIGHIISKYLDRGVIEFIGPFGLSNTITNLSTSIDKNQEYHIPSLALYLIIAFLAILTFSSFFEFSRILSLIFLSSLFLLSLNCRVEMVAERYSRYCEIIHMGSSPIDSIM